MKTPCTIVGIAALALLSAALHNHAAAQEQETPLNGPATYTYLPETLLPQLQRAGVVGRDLTAIRKVITTTTEQGSTIVLEMPPENLSESLREGFVNVSDGTTGSASEEVELVLMQVNVDGSIDLVSPQGHLQQIK